MGWKEIGTFLHTSHRTAQRWERLGLPVHRLPTSKSAIVFASRAEVQHWLTTANGQQAVSEGEIAAADPEEHDDGATSSELIADGDDPSGRNGTVEPAVQDGDSEVSDLPGMQDVGDAVRRSRVPDLALTPRVVWLGSLSVIAILALAALPFVVRGFRPRASTSAATGARSSPGDAPSGRTEVLRLKMPNGASHRIGSLEGTVSTLSLPGHQVLALSSREANDVLLVHIYRTPSASPSTEDTLEDVGSLTLHRGEVRAAPIGSGIQTIEWVKTLPPPAPGVDPGRR